MVQKPSEDIHNKAKVEVQYLCLTVKIHKIFFYFLQKNTALGRQKLNYFRRKKTLCRENAQYIGINISIRGNVLQ